MENIVRKGTAKAGFGRTRKKMDLEYIEVAPKILMSISQVEYAYGITLSREYRELNFGLICKWLVEKHGRMTIQNLTSLFNDTFSTRVPVTKIADKMKAYGLWETFVTDSFDEYIENHLIIDAVRLVWRCVDENIFMD